LFRKLIFLFDEIFIAKQFKSFLDYLIIKEDKK